METVLPRLRTAYDLTEKIEILDTLERWELKDNPTENLGTEFQEMLKNESSIRSQMTNKKDILQRLHAVITDLYVDWERAKGSYRFNLFILQFSFK